MIEQCRVHHISILRYGRDASLLSLHDACDDSFRPLRSHERDLGNPAIMASGFGM